MNTTLLETELVSLEEELKVVRAQMLTFKKPGKKKRCFSSLAQVSYLYSDPMVFRIKHGKH
jgi:hypothetical protein